MSACCGDLKCRRTQPIALYRGDFSGIVYAVTRADRVNEHTAAARDRHEVTDQMERFIRQNADWVREILAKEG